MHHPHSGKRDATIISLDSPISVDSISRSKREAKPWAPFRRREDFEFCETVVTQALNEDTIQKILNGLNGRWATGPKVTLRNLADYHQSMAAAQHFSIRVCLLLLTAHIWSDKNINLVSRRRSYTFFQRERLFLQVPISRSLEMAA